MGPGSPKSYNEQRHTELEGAARVHASALAGRCECANAAFRPDACPKCNAVAWFEHHSVELAEQLEAAKMRIVDLETQNRALQTGALQSFATQRTGLLRELELERDVLRSACEDIRHAYDVRGQRLSKLEEELQRTNDLRTRTDDACYRARELERQRDEHRASLNQIADRLHVVHEDPKIVAAVIALCSERDRLHAQIRLLTTDRAAQKTDTPAAIDDDACAELFVAFHVSSTTASQRALWGPDHPALPPGTCRYCGKPRQKWTGSKLDGHAACIVTENFKRRVGLVLRSSPRLTYKDIAKLLDVTPGIVRSWAFTAGVAGPIQKTVNRQKT